MGSCVSVHKDRASAMKLRLTFGSKTDKVVLPSPIKEKPIAVVYGGSGGGGDRTGSGSSFRDLSSKDEAFFDSQAWLESDCEDDFFSVNGDFTPSRGNTPVHHKFSAGSPRINTSLVVEKPSIFLSEPSPSPSPGEKKKRLSDLFKESLRIDHGQEKADEDDVEANETPYLSGATSVCSSERTPSRGFKSEEETMKPVQCCLPKLRLSRRYNDEKKKTIMTPTPTQTPTPVTVPVAG